MSHLVAIPLLKREVYSLKPFIYPFLIALGKEHPSWSGVYTLFPEVCVNTFPSLSLMRVHIQLLYSNITQHPVFLMNFPDTWGICTWNTYKCMPKVVFIVISYTVGFKSPPWKEWLQNLMYYRLTFGVFLFFLFLNKYLYLVRMH